MSSLELEAKFSASRLAISCGSHLAFPSESFKKVVKLSGFSRVYMLYSVLYNFRRYVPEILDNTMNVQNLKFLA